MPGFLKAAFLVGFFIVSAIVSLNMTRITRVELSGASCVPADELGLKGKLIFFISEKQLGKELTEKYSCVSSLKLQKIYPRKVQLEIQSENPVAKIANTQLATTASGLIVQDSQPNLPLLFLPTNTEISPGQKITDEISLYATKLAALLAKSDFHTTNIRIVNPDIAVYDASNTVAIFSSSQSAEIQVDSLQLVLSKAKMGEQKIRKIDLRFEKPAVTFK